MSIIADNYVENKPIIDSMFRFYDNYIGGKTMRSCGIVKEADKQVDLESIYGSSSGFLPVDNTDQKPVPKKGRCVAAKKLLLDYMIVFLLSFSIFQLFRNKLFFEEYEKDTLYRFLSREGANWEMLQMKTASKVIADIEKQTTDNHIRALIFDDSLYRRASGKKTEFCGKVFDHNDRKMRVGYRMMTAGWTNSDVFIPVEQHLLTTTDKKLQVGPFEHRDGRRIEEKRRKIATKKGTQVIVEMTKHAKNAGIPFEYVLFDTWFSNPAQLVDLKELNVDVIAMVKKNSTKYCVPDPKTNTIQKLDVKEIYSRNKKRRGRSRYLLSVNATVERDGTTIDVKLVYARNRNNRKEWVCFVCTKMDLSEEEILHTYTCRWAIEVYFKTVKSYMKLTSECHSCSYDALTAHMVIVALRYMALAVDKFYSSDNRTIYEYFEQAKREVIDSLIDAGALLSLDCLLDAVFEVMHPTKEQLREIYLRFFENLPESWKRKFNKPTYESAKTSA